MPNFYRYLTTDHPLIQKALNLNEHHKLATLGDSILKLTLCEILYEQHSKLSEEIKKYNTDRILVEVIGKNYNIHTYIHHHNNEENYIYVKTGKSKSNPRKYIASTLEALIGAIYKISNHSMDEIRSIIKTWINLIDNK